MCYEHEYSGGASKSNESNKRHVDAQSEAPKAAPTQESVPKRLFTVTSTYTTTIEALPELASVFAH